MLNALRNLLTFFLFLLVAWGMGLEWFIFQVPGEPAEDASVTDAIVVLTGGGQRLEHGLELLEQGRAKVLFISGVEEGITPSMLLRKKEYRMFAKLPPDSIVVGYKAHSTRGNADETAEWMEIHRVKSIRLVTANYHMPRSLYELHHAAPNVRIVPDPVFPNSGMRLFTLLLSEYNKYVASIIDHKLWNHADSVGDL